MLIAVDIGNSRIKFGRFDSAPGSDCQQAALAGALPIAGPALPEPIDTLTLETPVEPGSGAAAALHAWLASEAATRVVVASVNRPLETALIKTLAGAAGFAGPIVSLSPTDLPVAIHVEHPERVGVDRLLGAVAANRLRRAGRAAVVVDLGTAITVDLVAADGAFEGGAILPGIAMASRALHERTDALPDSGLTELDASPDAVGKNTAGAIHAGLFWGAVGAVRELIARQSDRLTHSPHVYLTGGAAPSVARLLGGPDLAVRYVPHLVLSGIAIAAPSLAASPSPFAAPSPPDNPSPPADRPAPGATP
ncbi:MAG: type III pantothenate kinase [Planctomycetota bacterium]